jgi:cytosine/adenosine deaminase-related metal-dependent hydrolase
MNFNNEIIKEGAIAVKDGIIIDIGSTKNQVEKYEPHHFLDATNFVVMPGLIDVYAHAGHAMIKGIWHPFRGWPSNDLYFNATTEEFWYADGLLAAVDRIKCGVTTGVSIIGATPARIDDPIFAEKHAEAIMEIGIRDIIGVGPPDPFIPSQNRLQSTIWENGKSKTHSFTYDETIDNSIHIIKRWHNKVNGRIQVALAFPYICGRLSSHSKHGSAYQYKKEDVSVLVEKAQEMRRLSDKYKVQIHSHLFGGALEYGLKKFGKKTLYEILGPDVILAHCNSLTDTEIAILTETKTNVASAPSAISPTVYGRCPVPELINAGVCVATTTDGAAPTMSFDPFISIRSELRIQKYHFQDPSILPAGKALKMVTIDAARALGLDSQIGSIEKGKKADLILIDMFNAHLTPSTMLPQILVFYGSGHDVSTVIVDGNIIMENKKIKTMEETRVIEIAKAEINNAFERFSQLGFKLEPYTEITDSYWSDSKYDSA